MRITLVSLDGQVQLTQRVEPNLTVASISWEAVNEKFHLEAEKARSANASRFDVRIRVETTTPEIVGFLHLRTDWVLAPNVALDPLGQAVAWFEKQFGQNWVVVILVAAAIAVALGVLLSKKSHNDPVERLGSGNASHGAAPASERTAPKVATIAEQDRAPVVPTGLSDSPEWHQVHVELDPPTNNQRHAEALRGLNIFFDDRKLSRSPEGIFQLTVPGDGTFARLARDESLDERFQTDSQAFEIGRARVEDGAFFLTLVPQKHAFVLLAHEQGTSRPLADLNFRIQPAYGQSVTKSTGRDGTAGFQATEGHVSISLVETGALHMAPVEMELESPKNQIIVVEIGIKASGIRAPAAIEIRPPASLGGKPLLAQVSTIALQTYAGAWHDLWNRPDFHTGKSPASTSTLPKDVNDAIEDMCDAIDELFREKQVQAHLAGPMNAAWARPFAWARNPLPNEMREDVALAEVEALRASVDARLTQQAKSLVIRPGIRLLSLSDHLIRRVREEQKGLPFVLAADLVLRITDLFLTDPTLAKEWSKG
ncbi:MAG: hypothetical protein HY556_04890 [Euryarchaeota archaeon]|nr:hypothetical protein [Euryarchaeota archaeon]